MRRYGLRVGLFALLAGSVAAACSSTDGELVVVENANARVGTAALALTIPADLTVTTVTAYVTFPGTGHKQEHAINVQPSGSSASIYFRLPVANGYSVQLKASATQAGGGTVPCKSDPVSFNISANTETLVSVSVVCSVPGGGVSSPSGSASITGDFSVIQAGCDALINKIVVAPVAISDGSVPVTVEVFPRSGKENATLTVSAAAGTLSKVNDTTWSFVCGPAGGTVNLTASATLDQCTESATVGFACPSGTPSCGNGQIDPGEACDGAALPAGTPSGSSCASDCLSVLPPPASCGDGVINGSELCDTNGANPDVLPAGTPAGSTCAADCLSIVGPPASCPNGVLNPGEQCDDGNTVNDDRCSNTCVFTANSACGACTRDNCAAERADVDANLEATTPMLECVIGPDWEAVERAAPTSCANQDLFSCYCGSIPGPQCVNTTPAALLEAGAPCVAPVLAGTNCTTSICVGPIYNNPANANGKAIQYLTCQQNFCFEQCFNF